MFLIPAGLDQCGVPIDQLEELDYADLFPLDDLVEELRAGRFCRSCTRRLNSHADLQTAVDALIAWGRRRRR